MRCRRWFSSRRRTGFSFWRFAMSIVYRSRSERAVGGIDRLEFLLGSCLQMFVAGETVGVPHLYQIAIGIFNFRWHRVRQQSQNCESRTALAHGLCAICDAATSTIAHQAIFEDLVSREKSTPNLWLVNTVCSMRTTIARELVRFVQGETDKAGRSQPIPLQV